jgi:outer membrane protein TolC
VASKIKAITVSVNKLYNAIQKLKYKEDIYVSQNKILRERLKISYRRYMKGEGSYKEYSDTLKLYTDSLRARLLNESLLHASILQMYIISGKNLY